MSTRSADINLIVRARTEGERAISGLGNELAQLLSTAHDGTADIEALGRTLGALDKAAAVIAQSMDKAGNAVDRQRASFAENNAAYAALLRQQAEARRIADDLAKQPQAQKGFVGPKANGFAEQLRGAQSEVRNLDSAVSALFAKINGQGAALTGGQSSLLKLSATGTAISEAQKEAEARIELTTQAIRDQTAAAERLTAIQQRINRATGVDRPDSTGQAANAASLLISADDAFNRTAAAEAAMDAQARRLKDTLNPLAAIQERLNTDLAAARALYASGRIGAQELAAAEAQLAVEAKRAGDALSPKNGGKQTLFGLKPYELQNLSYQVNDVVTGLASGQHFTQIIAQQGAQVLQVFPKLSAQVFGALTNPAFLASVATVGVLALSMKRAADDADRLRGITAQLGSRADGGQYNAAQLAAQEKQFERLGATSDEARKATTAFLNESIAPDKLQAFATAAQAVSESLGTDLPSAANEVAKAFTGGYAAVAALDDKLNFLTATEREHVRVLFEEGNAAEARNTAFAIFSQKQQKLAEDSRGPWAGAARELKGAYSDFINLLANTAVVDGFAKSLENLAGVARIAIQAFSDDPAVKLQELNDKKAYIAELQVKLAKNPNDNLSRLNLQNAKGALDTIIRQYNELAAAKGRAKVDGAGNLIGATGSAGLTSANDNSPAAKAAADRVAEISRETELQSLRDAGQVRILGAKDRARRIELAGIEAAKDADDASVAAALRKQAISRETAAVDRERQAREKSNLADRNKAISDFLGRVNVAEGGTAQNPHSTARGYGQFTEGTFIDQFKKVFPTQSSLSRDKILELRLDATTAKAIAESYARENAKALEKFGAAVTAGNLYLSHFLGATGAKAVLTAPSSRPVDQILGGMRGGAAVLSGNQGYLRTENGKGRYRTASELQSFIANRVGDTAVSAQQAQTALNDLIDEAKRKQDDFNLSVEHGFEDRARAVEGLKTEAGLFGNALIAEKRRQVIAQAVLDLQQKTEDANRSLKPGQSPVVASDDQIAKTKELAGALYDAQTARERLQAPIDATNTNIDALKQQRDLLIEQRDLLRSMGEFSSAATVQEQIDSLNDSLAQGYDTLVDFLGALSPAEQVELGFTDPAQLEAFIGNLKKAKSELKTLDDVMIGGAVSGRQFLDAFSSAATDAFTGFIRNVAAGKNVFKSFGQAVRDFALGFISALAQLIIKMIAFGLALLALSAVTHIPVFVLANIAGVAASVHHDGGIAGSGGGARRSVNPAIFADAARYHRGGIAGLGADEVPAILKRNEEVLTEGDPRHRFNGGLAGGGQGANVSVKTVLVHDAAAALQEALRSPIGERVLIQHVQDNAGAFRAAIGG